MSQKHRPLVIEIKPTDPAPHPADAPVINDDLSTVAQRPYAKTGGRIWTWLATLLASLFFTYMSIQLWDFAWAIMARNDSVGWIFLGLLGTTFTVMVIAIAAEILAIVRLKTMDRLSSDAQNARLSNDPKQAQKVQDALIVLYADRPELHSDINDLRRQSQDQFDAFALLDVTETKLLGPLDLQARVEIEKAARQVATITALLPLAMADVIVALATNVRMIRRIAEIYGGRGGMIASWRLLRAVMSHLVATGAVAVGDDWLGSIFGGSLLAKLSRRFGEGMINAALTARVGRAAIDVCRPMPFHVHNKPRVSSILQRALTGVFDKEPS